METEHSIVAPGHGRDRSRWLRWTALLGLVVALTSLPGVGLADDDENKKKDKQTASLRESSQQQTIGPIDDADRIRIPDLTEKPGLPPDTVATPVDNFDDRVRIPDLTEKSGLPPDTVATPIDHDRVEQIGQLVGENTWTDRAPMPTSRFGLGLAAAQNGKLYAVGGYNNGGAQATVEEYDPDLNTWRARVPLPTPRSGLGLAVASNGRLYAVGGNNGSAFLATVEEYDPATNTWTARAPLPTARYALGLAAAQPCKL